MAVLDKEFHRAMVDGYTRAKRECGYTATRFLQLVADQGGVRAAKTLLNKGETSEGFGKLWEYGRLDLTMEALVASDRFAKLFTQEEVRTARQRLRDHGYDPSAPSGPGSRREVSKS